MLTKPNVNPEQFLHPNTKEVVYILGLLWGDGCISNKGYSIRCEMISDDLDSLLQIFLTTGKWYVYKRQRNNWKPVTCYIANSKLLYDFLVSMNYKTKFESANKILNIIPKDLVYYWYRGLIDADGCFYKNDKEYLKQFSLGGPYEQNWDFMETLFQYLDIQYRIRQNISKKQHRSSCIRITNKTNIKKLGDFIYQDYDGLGLARKYQKYLSIINS